MKDDSDFINKISSVDKKIACDRFSNFFNRREGMLDSRQYFWEIEGLRVVVQSGDTRNDVQRMSIEIKTSEASIESIIRCLDIFWGLISKSTPEITKSCVEYINTSKPIDQSLIPSNWKLISSNNTPNAIQLVVAYGSH